MDQQSNRKSMVEVASRARQVLQEPLLKLLLAESAITETQLETLLIDLVIEDNYRFHITYDDKASFRFRAGTRTRGVTRGAFNRTLKQARKNVTQCLYTMLLLTYLGLFELTIFRPFEEVAARIGDYRRIREILAGKSELTQEDLEAVKVSERTIASVLEELSSSLTLKTDISRKRSDE
jgi:predicted DNA-binding protein (UPF0251 family)